VVADPFHNTGSLMTEDCGKRRRQVSVSARNVRVANTDCDNPDQYVRLLEIRKFDLFDDEWLSRVVSDGGCNPHNQFLIRVRTRFPARAGDQDTLD
jgi:hypothetical protein